MYIKLLISLPVIWHDKAISLAGIVPGLHSTSGDSLSGDFKSSS